ncbi:TPA: DUF551 domain-containing protein [Serratia marcescens]
MTLTTEQLNQIKADISARKAMPEYGESVEGNIERLRVIGATRSHFSTETVEMLVRALEEKSRVLADAERERDDWVEHSRKMEHRAIESGGLQANREAQPVAWEMRYWNSGHNMWHEWERITAEQHAEMSVKHAADNDYEFRVLYDAPPAPAVPKEMTVEQAYENVQTWHYANGWNACRAAMLAQPVSSGYKLPEGWIACSERMPDADGAYWCWFGKEKPSVIQQRVCIWNDRNHEWCDSAVTHWMPLPVAPEGGN